MIVRYTSAGDPFFNLDLNLSELDLPADAAVVAEAYRRTEFARFPYGTVGLPRPASLPLLKGFTEVDGLLFRVKVVYEQNGRPQLLAEADRVRPTTEGARSAARETLLPVVRGDDLGEELWVLDFTVGEPQLVINGAVSDWRSVPMLPFFRVAVFPSLLRMILQRVLGDEDQTDDLDSWQERWLKFAESLPGVEARPPGQDERKRSAWIDDVVKSFSRAHHIKDQFLRLTE